MDRFRQLFGRDAEASGSAPGRVNLLGEHTDYNLGLVLPLAIPQRTVVEVAAGIDHRHHFHSEQLGTGTTIEPGGELPEGFARYMLGCIEVLREAGHAVGPIAARVTSEVPIGAGLSSSAALEVALLRALRERFALPVDDEAIAHFAHAAETRFAGVRCGILDQMACSFAGTDRMLRLDTRSLERRLVPLPDEAALLVVDSGESRQLATSGYNARRGECERAAALLGVASLRDIEPETSLRGLPAPLDRRVRHVVSENARVRTGSDEALPAEAFGALMNRSHASLSEDYEVSTPTLDALVAVLQDDTDVFGAKLTGAGFGGACVALVRAGRAAAVAARLEDGFGRTHPRCGVLVIG